MEEGRGAGRLLAEDSAGHYDVMAIAVYCEYFFGDAQKLWESHDGEAISLFPSIIRFLRKSRK